MSDDFADQLTGLLDEAGLLPCGAAMLRAGYTREQVNDMTVSIAFADDPAEAMAEIDKVQHQAVQAAELEQFITELPERGRTEEIQRIATAYHIPVANTRACVDAAEQHDRLMGPENPFRR